METLSKLLKELSVTRPIFHSERDFQHELAWLIHKKGHSVRLEFPIRHNNKKNTYLDILVNPKSKHPIGIELKYKTKKINNFKIGNEKFSLTNHAAVPLGRYDFWFDVFRLETLFKLKIISVGYAIFLTNDSAYWNSARKNTNGFNFTMHKRDNVKGILKWNIEPKIKSVGKNRMHNIKLNGNYNLKWNTYSRNFNNVNLNFLILEVR